MKSSWIALRPKVRSRLRAASDRVSLDWENFTDPRTGRFYMQSHDSNHANKRCRLRDRRRVA